MKLSLLKSFIALAFAFSHPNKRTTVGVQYVLGWSTFDVGDKNTKLNDTTPNGHFWYFLWRYWYCTR